MNKIYKVIWSKVKHQYVVVSELAHSNGKQSRTAKRSLRSRIAALVVCGAIAAFGVFGTQNVMAAEPEGGLATIDQYVAYKYNQGDGFQSGYKKVFVRDKNSTNPFYGQYYWVRNGYTVEGEYVQKQDGTGTTFVISKVYAPNSNISDVLVTSDVTIDGTGVVTNSGEELNSVELGNYAAVSNGGSGGAEANTKCHYIIETENGWKNVGVGSGKFNTYFKTVNSENGLKYDDEKGVYTYKGEVVSSDNIYYIKDGDTVNAGVFVVNGEVYKSTVYGNTKEILTTVKDENGSLKTFWSTEAESSDIYLKDSNIKVSDLNTAFDTIEANEKRLENNDIRKITVTPNENKIGLVRNSDKEVDGSIYVSSVVGKNGNAQVKFAQKGEDGQETSLFVVDAGSIVKANPEGATSGTKLSTVAINGINYQLATGISGGEVGDDGTVYITQEGSTEKTPIGKIEVVGTDVNVTSEQTTNDDGVKGIKYTVSNNLTVAEDKDTDENKGNWTITDASKPEGQQTFTNTTLDKAGSTVADGTTANGKVYGKTYTVKDTSGNTIQLTDVASGSVLQNVDSRVTTIEGNVITQGVRDTTGDTPKGNLLLQNAKGETVATVTGLEDYALKDQTVTVDDDGNAVFKVTDRYDPSKSYDVKLDGLVTEAGMATANNLKVEADNDGDGNNGNWTITDASKPEGQQTFTNTTLDKAGSTVADGTTANGKVYGKTYTVKDTSGNTIQLIDVASGNVLQNVDSKVGDTNYSSTNYIHNEDNLTTAASILDSNIKATADKVDAGWTATDGKTGITVSPTNNTLKFAGDDNITVTADDKNNTISVGLNDNITLGKGDNQININATGTDEENSSGKIVIGQGNKTVEINNSSITLNKSLVIDGSGVNGAIIHGLSNNNWDPKEKDNSTTAATEGQLYDVYDSAVKYDNSDNKATITLEGSDYNGKQGGGTHLTNVAYATGKDGSEAVNVDYLKDNAGELVAGNNNLKVSIDSDNDGNKDNWTITDTQQEGIVFKNTTLDVANSTSTPIGESGEKYGQNFTIYDTAGNAVKIKDIASAEVLKNVDTRLTSTEGDVDVINGTLAGAVMYDKNGDSYNKESVTLGGKEYNKETKQGGTHLTNVAYATGKDGSEAVNVDYLNDAIKDAVKDGPVATNEKHLDTSTSYAPNEKGEIAIDELDGTGNKTGNQLVINNVASKDDIKDLNDKVGNVDFSGTTHIDKDTNNLTDAIKDLDGAISNMQDEVLDQVENSTITGGHVTEDGKVVLEKGEDNNKSNVETDIQLTDSGVVQEGTSFDKETGTITITSQDKYSGETSSVKVEGIASTEVVGATNKEDLATAYKDADKDGNATTEYITDSESMVEADVALDHAIQDVAGTSYANDMVLSNRIDSVEKRLGNVEERIDKVGAMAAAIANLRTMGFDPEAPTEIAIGVGQYKSETGIAIGVFHYPNQDFMLSASLSSSGDELMGGIGATWKLGRKSAAERAKDEEARHLEQAEEMKKLAQQEKVKAQAQRHAKLLAERQQASQKNA